MIDLPLLFLDPRQGSGDLYPLLPREHTELSRLDDAEGRGIGDAMSSGYGPAGPIMWGIEIKRLSDALQCLQDGRLAASQLPRMHAHFDYVFLLIEEDITINTSNGYLRKRVRKQQKGGKWSEFQTDVVYGARQHVMYADFCEWLVSLSIGGGARLLRSGSREETAAIVTAIWKWFAKPWSEHKSLKVFDDSHPPRFIIPSKAAKVARDLADGVGWEKAMSAAEHFGSVRNLVNATTDEWMAVDGIGAELAARVVAGVAEEHRHIEKRGGRHGRPYGNVLSASNRADTSKRRADSVPLPRSDVTRSHGGTGRRKTKVD